MARIRVDYDDRALKNNVAHFKSDLRSAVHAVADRRAAETTAWLKRNAPWTDRTGAARSGLFAVPMHGAGFAEIYMAYSVNYGIWLEVANDRRFSVLQPAMRIQGEAFMNDMKLLIDRMNTAAATPAPTHGIPKQADKPNRRRRNNRRRRYR
jgi:hypothetical protein